MPNFCFPSISLIENFTDQLMGSAGLGDILFLQIQFLAQQKKL